MLLEIAAPKIAAKRKPGQFVILKKDERGERIPLTIAMSDAQKGTVSVIFQVVYFRLTGGQRIFRMAPIHHHFELKGWAESKVTVRFWIIAIILALLSVSTLKLR